MGTIHINNMRAVVTSRILTRHRCLPARAPATCLPACLPMHFFHHLCAQFCHSFCLCLPLLLPHHLHQPAFPYYLTLCYTYRPHHTTPHTHTHTPHHTTTHHTTHTHHTRTSTSLDHGSALVRWDRARAMVSIFACHGILGEGRRCLAITKVNSVYAPVLPSPPLSPRHHHVTIGV